MTLKLKLHNISFTHHSSRIFLVTGQAQHALHFGFSPGASFEAGARFSIDAGTVADAVFPIIRKCDFEFLKCHNIEKEFIDVTKLHSTHKASKI